MATSDTQLIIDIAAQLTGQETSAELDRMGKSLSGVSRWSESLDAAMVSAQSSLDGASSEVNRVTRALEGAKKAHAASFSTTGEATSATWNYAAAISGLDSELKTAQAAQARYQKQLTGTAKLTQQIRQRTGDAATRFSALRGALGDAGGALGGLGEKALFPIQAFVDLREHFGGTTAAMVTGVGIFAQVAAAAVKTALAVGVLTAAVTALAIGVANHNRDAGLTAEAFAVMNAAASGVDFASITQATNVSADALRGLTKSLLATKKVSGEDLPAALKAAAIAEKALGTGGASEFIQRIKDGKLAVSEFAVEAQQKFGGIVERRLLGLGDQLITLKRNISQLFGGLNIEGVLTGLSKIVGMFSETHAAGRAIKFFFEGAFKPLIEGADEAFYVFEAFVLGFLIGATKIYIALKPAIKAVKEFLGFDDPSTTDWLLGAKSAGELLAPVVLGVAAGFAVLAAAGVALIAGLAAVPLAMSALATAAAGVVVDVINWFKKLPETIPHLASDMIAGLVSGLTAGASAVIGAITGVVGGAIDAAKSMLGIASPSKVFMAIGENTGEGFVGGVEGTEQAAQGALASMVDPPGEGVSGSSSEGSGAIGRSGGSLDMSGAVFNFYGVEGAEDAETRFSEVLTRLIEGDAAQLGAT